jgi:hypothetical protein
VFGAVVRTPIKIPLDPMNWFQEFWYKQRPFTLALAGEAFRVFFILLCLLAIFESTKYMALRGYDKEYIEIIEKVEFVIALAAITRGGWGFIVALNARESE